MKHTIYHYSEADLEGLFSYLDGFSFHPVADVNYLWSLLKDSIQNSRTLFIPSSSHQPRSTPPWFTHEIRHYINCIHSLCRRHRRRPTSTLVSHITALESLLITQIDSAKSAYKSNLAASFHSNPRLLYRYLRHFSCTPSIPECVSYNSVYASNTHSKVDLFNSFFNSFFSSSDLVLPPMSQLPTPSNHLSSINVSSEDVYTALSSLDHTKALGCDQISPRLLTLCAGSIVESVTTLFCESLTNGCLPDEWKIHKITPIFKSGNCHSVTNYRLISLLCILSKVLESIVYSKIILFLCTFLCRQQFGFLKNHSAVSQLLVSFSSIMQHCENGHSTDQVYFDFWKAFNLVPHSILFLNSGL